MAKKYSNVAFRFPFCHNRSVRVFDALQVRCSAVVLCRRKVIWPARSCAASMSDIESHPSSRQLSMRSQASYRPASVLQRTVTSLPTVTSLTRLESLAKDYDKGLPVQVEGRIGRTLEDMLRTP